MRKEQEKQQGPDTVVERRCKQCAVLPYMKGITDRLQRAFKKHDILLYAKTGFTIRNVVVSPRDRLNLGQQ